MKNKHQAEELLLKYKNGTCTDRERAIAESWHLKNLSESDFMPDEEEMLRAGQAIWNALPIHQENAIPHEKRFTLPLWTKYAAAAKANINKSAEGRLTYQDNNHIVLLF